MTSAWRALSAASAAAIIFVAASVRANSGSSDFPELLKFEQLAALDAAKREAYLQGVRALLIELAAMSEEKDGFVAEHVDELQGRYAALRVLFPEANAGPKPPTLSDKTPVFRDNKWGCTGSGVIFDNDLGTCRLPARPTGPTCPTDSVLAYVAKKNLEGATYGVARSCVPTASWTALSEKRVMELSNEKGATSVAEVIAKGDTPEARQIVAGVRQTPMVTEVVAKPPPRAKPAVVPPKAKEVAPEPAKTTLSVTGGEDAIPVLNEKTKKYECLPKNDRIEFDVRLGTCRIKGGVLDDDQGCEGGKFREVRFAPSALRMRRVVRYCVPESSWSRLSEKRREELLSANGARSVASSKFASDRVEKLGKDIALGEKCAGPKFVCEGDWATRRKAYYDDPSVDTCIFSGNISKFIDGQKKPGRCQSVYEVNLSGATKYRCSSWKETLCNPLVFGVKKDGAAFCVPGKSAATKACNEASTPDTRMADYLQQNIAGVQEGWNEFRTGFNKLCKTSATSRNFHCEECQVMSDRLFAMNAMALGDRCGEMKEWSELNKPAAPAKKAD